MTDTFEDAIDRVVLREATNEQCDASHKAIMAALESLSTIRDSLGPTGRKRLKAVNDHLCSFYGVFTFRKVLNTKNNGGNAHE